MTDKIELRIMKYFYLTIQNAKTHCSWYLQSLYRNNSPLWLRL